MNGVGRLKLLELEVDFSFRPVLPPRGNAAAGANQSPGGETPEDTGQRETGSYQGEPLEELTDEDKETLEDVRRAQLMVDDPEAYEQEMIDALEGRTNG